MTTFENELDKLFRDSVDVNDTIWYSETQTLRDAIVELYEDVRLIKEKDTKWCPR